MNIKEKVLREYLRFLESGNLQAILNLFAQDAMVHSPLYGFIKAAQFYKDLLNDTANSKTNLKNILISSTDNFCAALHFDYVWTLKDGNVVKFEVVDIFYFDLSNKIKELKIIYDTQTIRPLISMTLTK